MKRMILIGLLTMIVGGLTAQNKTDWANYGRYAEANVALTKTPAVVFMGNSITEGWAREHPAFFADHNFVGRGISGQVSAQMLARFQSDVIALSPKMVVIMAGINDIAENNGPVTIEHIAENVISMCQLARANRIKPIILSVLPVDVLPWRRDKGDISGTVKSLNLILKDWAVANKCVYVDMWSEMANEKGGLSPNLAGDGVHPTSEGYDIMERIIAPYLKIKNVK
jgi:lysophospholipase L1-like esterase